MSIDNLGLLDIVVISIGLFCLYLSVNIFILSGRVKKIHRKELHINDLERDHSGGILTTHGMIRDKKGRGVIADSRPSATYLNSIINN